MQFHLASLFAIAAAVGVAAQNLQINTPTNIVQCLPQLITWSGGQGPYFVYNFFCVQPGGQPGAAALVDFGQQTGTSLTWVVNIQAGTSIGLTIRDQTGTVANSAPVNVGSSSDSGCLSSSLSVSQGSSTPGGASTSAGSATTTGASATSTSTSTRASGTTTSGSGSSSASATSAESSNAAVPFAQIGSAGVIGAFIAAVLA
ncbi:hypothetical protein ACEPAI_7029 [Sanghuangporus weigelae]